MDRRIIPVIIALVAAVLLCTVLVTAPRADREYEGQTFILHTNDTHGVYDNVVSSAEIAGYRTYLESKGATVFLLDAGDYFQGSAETSLTHGGSSFTVAEAVGYDVMVPGNHEFDYSMETYIGFVEALDTRIISANFVWKSTGECVFDPYVILERNGIRLGIFGLMTPDTVRNVVTGGMLSETDVTDPVTAAETMVGILDTMDCDYVIALGHIGLEREAGITSDQICSAVAGIDLFIDGHSHTEMRHGRPVDPSLPFTVSDTVIASTGEHLNHLGVVRLGSVIDADLIEDIAQCDSGVRETVDRMEAELDAVLGGYVCSTEIELVADRTLSRHTEVNFGDMICDIMLEITGADIAVFNSGNLRGNAAPGEVVTRDLYRILPYDTFVVVKDVPGDILLEALENSVSKLPQFDGRFLQVSGMTVTYDSSGDAGRRILEVMIGGSALDPGRTYAVVSSDYVMNGGDGYEMLGGIPDPTFHGELKTLLSAELMAVGTVTEDMIEMGRLFDTADA